MSSAEQRRLPEAFIAADRKADLAALEGLCASDVVSYSDGGGVVRAARTPIAGRDHRIDSTLSLRIYWSKYGTFRVAPGSRAIRNLSAPLS